MSYPKSLGRRSKGSSAKRETGATTSKSGRSSSSANGDERFPSTDSLIKSTQPKRRKTDYGAWLREPIHDDQLSSSTSTIS